MAECECGCGCSVPLAPRTDSAKGWVKGQPLRFLRFHHARRPGECPYVVDDAGCWVWQRVITSYGYGSTRKKGAHVVMYESQKGPVPEGMEIDHLCRNRACVNPAHLEPVTHGENTRRGARAKLTWEAVRAIRASPSPRRDLAAVYGVDYTTIADVQRRLSWWPEP